METAPDAGVVGYSSYAPSKCALRGLADCLRNEVLALALVRFPSGNKHTCAIAPGVLPSAPF